MHVDMTLTRRKFIKQTGLTLAFSVAGVEMLLTPAQAYAKAVRFKVLSAEEVAILEAIAEILLPGAREAGIAHFVDQQLSIHPNDSLLVLKYFDFPPPYADFYHGSLQGLDQFSRSLYGSEIGILDQEQGIELVESIRDGRAEHWVGPPPPLVYHALRNDAIDVVYGTVDGFKKLGIPYMEHILPPEKW